MSLLLPDYSFYRIYEIPLSFFREHSIEALVLDVDNTLTTHNNPEPSEQVLSWLAQMRKAGIKMMIVSNNHPQRVRPFAERLQLDFVADGAKPLPKGILEAARKMETEPSHLAVIGDQLFTDIAGAHTAKAIAILVEPMELESMWFFKVKRALERPFLRAYQRKAEKR